MACSDGGNLSGGHLLWVCTGQVSKPNESSAKHKEIKWATPNVEAPLPAGSESVPCNLSKVLEQAGARAVELTTALEDFTASEEIRYEKLGQSGAVEESDSSVFDYTLAFETRGCGRAIQEYRSPSKGGHPFAASSQATGQAALALIFLPSLQTDYDITCEGVDKWNGQLAYVTHFEQKKDKPPRTLQFRSGKGVYPVMLRGRAWISTENAHVLHLETNLVQPQFTWVEGADLVMQSCAEHARYRRSNRPDRFALPHHWNPRWWRDGCRL